METGQYADELHQADDERNRDLQELARLTRRYKQLTWCTSAKEQQERAGLDTPIMKLYSTLFPRSPHVWHQEYEVVMRSARHSVGGPSRTPARQLGAAVAHPAERNTSDDE